jgi:DNA polymerase-3 subunit delta'
MRAFAAALQCPRSGCGECESCRAVLVGVDSDVTFLERSGTAWSVSDFAEAERISRRRPFSGPHQIVALESVDLGTQSVAKLLKILEEPPSKSIFLLSAESVDEALVTIASRCVEITVAPLSTDVITEYLVREGQRCGGRPSGRGGRRRGSAPRTGSWCATRVSTIDWPSGSRCRRDWALPRP